MGKRIAFCLLGMVVAAGGITSASQDPSGAAEEIKAALGPEIPGMVPVQRWNFPDDLSGFEIRDLYKHVHHAYLGPGHAIPSPEEAKSFLAAEWSELGAALEGEELLQFLVRGAPFVRVHLRPYRDRGGSVDSVLKAFLLSAEVPTDSAAFVSVWNQVGEAIAAGRLPFAPAAFDSLDGAMRAEGYPAVHHSERFLRAHRPAYRVVSRREAEALLQQLNQAKTDH